MLRLQECLLILFWILIGSVAGGSVVAMDALTMMSFADFDQAAKVVSYLSTPLVAVVGAVIAWQQWKLNTRKYQADLYDRRLKVYEQVKKILSITVQKAGASMEDLVLFRTSVSEADFLFEPEIVIYIDEIYSRGLKLAAANEEYRDYTQTQPPGYDHKKIVAVRSTEARWAYDQLTVAKTRFGKYLRIDR